MINWFSYHFSVGYLFNRSPEIENNLILGLTIYFVLLIIIGLVLAKQVSKYAKKLLEYEKLREKILSDFLAFGIGGLILVFIRYQSIPYFSAPVILLIFILVNTIVFWYILMFYIKHSKPKIKNISIEENYKKYLPKPKRKQ